MTATINTDQTHQTGEGDHVREAGPVVEPVFLTGPGYTLTARQVVHAVASYLTCFGDNIGIRGVSLLDAIHSEVAYGTDIELWQHSKTPAEVATTRARAEQLACEFFGHHFPVIPW